MVSYSASASTDQFVGDNVVLIVSMCPNNVLRLLQAVCSFCPFIADETVKR